MPELNIFRTDCDFDSFRALVENSVVELEEHFVLFVVRTRI
jgi:hypothetical protein